MEKVLWHLLTATRGGTNRVRILNELSERPKTASQLADDLNVTYKTVRYHLDILEDHHVVGPGEENYGQLYFLTDRFHNHNDTFEDILEQVE